MNTETLNNHRMGLRDSMPVAFGYITVSFAFGIIAASFGFTIPEAVMISMFNLTSAGQLAALPIISGGGGFLELAMTELLINLRYSLMSISLSQRFDKKIKAKDKLYLAYTLTDEIFAVAIGKRQTLGKKYLLSLVILPYIAWVLGTFAGALAGSILPPILTTTLGMSMYAMFIAILVPVMKKERPILICVLLSIALSCIFRFVPVINGIPDGFIIIICALTVSVALALIFPITNEDSEERYEEVSEI